MFFNVQLADVNIYSALFQAVEVY